MRLIKFYKDENEKSPVEEFLDSLTAKQARKVTWVLNIIEEFERIPKQYYKNLVNTDGIYEVRVQSGNDIFRLLSFQHKCDVIVLTNGFVKKTQKTPKNEILLAEKRKEDWLRRNKWVI